MRRAIVLAAALLGALPELAAASVSRVPNFETHSTDVVCGIVADVHGTSFDPGTGAQLDGNWPGLQCGAPGIPRPPQAVGDPFVQLGQGHAGRAKIVDESQDDLTSNAKFVALAPGSVWKRDGITCHLSSSSVRCANSAGRGFQLSPNHLSRF